MKRKDLVNLLNRAAAAIETPGDIELVELNYLVVDLLVAATKISEKEGSV